MYSYWIARDSHGLLISTPVSLPGKNGGRWPASQEMFWLSTIHQTCNYFFQATPLLYDLRQMTYLSELVSVKCG